MFSALAEIRFRMSKKFAMSFRGEIFNDASGFLSGLIHNSDGKITGLNASGFTLGLEYKPLDNAFLRWEGRFLMADISQKIFKDNSNTRFESIANIGVWF